MKLTLADIQNAERALAAAGIPTFEGCYFMALHPTHVQGIVVDSMIDNTADKWAAREHELRERYGS